MRHHHVPDRQARRLPNGGAQTLTVNQTPARIHHRNRIPAKRGTDPASLFEIRMPIPDKPGVIAEVATLVGNQGINIEDFQLVHSAEGGQGLLYLVMSGEEPASRAQAALERAGYAARLHPL